MSDQGWSTAALPFGVSACLCTCVYLCMFVLVWLCMCVYVWAGGSRWTTGHCCDLWEFDRVIQSPLTLLPSLPDWGFQFSLRGWGEEVQRVNLSPPPSPLPLSSLFRDTIRTYADDISLFVVEKKNHICLLCKEPGGGVNEAHRPETITR